MPRSRGGGARKRGGGGLFGGKAPAKASQAPPPAVPQRQGGGGGFLGTMMQGFALGTGSAVAHEAIHGAVRSFSGGSDDHQAQTPSGAPEVCGAQQKAFVDCMQANNGEMTMCQYYFDAMQKCKVGGDNLQY
ncbi:hypothetical protein HOP50_02g10880 [Chloropicon primus]|uniref:CHCH domain-containing protein n=2 Tax=Chloropicon primus TaxID=1764295 RepID=A0A5B8MEI9_9CHLO|nr:hypothetical protein A3770_02p11020 [Chloropicon primus]UPQ97793.1 hypothetical protein HOP50_02g10880 [Chloropicon primus]|eukprot:QDZ18584.1 hypothetical protein A3770_02p11020 [Chloropicon primus]